MIPYSDTDIVLLLRQVTKMLRPFAVSHDIILKFQSKEKKIILSCRPDLVINDVTCLICHLISYTPSGNAIFVDAMINKKENTNSFEIRVNNTGINLSQVAEITRSCYQQVTVEGDNENKQTHFKIGFPKADTNKQYEKNDNKVAVTAGKVIPEYYNEIRKRLSSHFSKADNLVSQLSILYPQEAVFLQKVNAVIIANVENELFDTSALGREMNMSRTNLFRRLKPLIRQAPATYIKSIRLQKAKELLETTDITVGQAAFKTGFQTQSHFTKAFTEAFGFRPSTIRRKNQSETNE